MCSMYMKVLRNERRKTLEIMNSIDSSTVQGRKDREIIQEEISFVEQLMELEERRINIRAEVTNELETANS